MHSGAETSKRHGPHQLSDTRSLGLGAGRSQVQILSPRLNDGACNGVQAAAKIPANRMHLGAKGCRLDPARIDSSEGAREQLGSKLLPTWCSRFDSLKRHAREGRGGPRDLGRRVVAYGPYERQSRLDGRTSSCETRV
jgi:hypothetical protein